MAKVKRPRGPCQRARGSQPRDRSPALNRGRWALWAAATVALLAAVAVAAVLVRQHQEIPPDLATEALIHNTTAATQRLVQQYPNDPAPWRLMGQMFRQFGDADQALAAWEKCLSLGGEFVDAHLGIGAVRLERGEHGQAETASRKALTLQPDSFEATVLLAHALINQGKFRDTVALLEGRVKEPGAAMPCYLLLGQAYLQSKEYAKAKPCFETAVRMAPDFANAHYGLATACTRLGLAREAEEHFKRFRAAEAARLSKQIDGAKQPGDDAARVRQSAAEVYAYAASLYAAHGDAPQAERHRREAEKLSPSGPRPGD